MIGATFDTGALIALERLDQSMAIRLRVLHQARMPITIPASVIAEWWRKGHGQQAILDIGRVEPLTEEIAKAAGEALRNVRGAAAIDATVMASAAARGDRVFTSDPADMQRLQAHFRSVVDIIPV
ncbi:MAG: hypothetical protein MJD61_08510 [Proteobacteria bacterium]|nr:hypothetical protein [Pseudomonadota bacterium]